MKGSTSSAVLRLRPLLLLAVLLVAGGGGGGRSGPVLVRGVSAEEETTASASATAEETSSNGSDQSGTAKVEEEEVVAAAAAVVDTFDAKDHTDWGSYYDPKNIFCGKYGTYHETKQNWVGWTGGGGIGREVLLVICFSRSFNIFNTAT